MKPELVVALDVATTSQVESILALLPQEISIYKVGLELFCADAYRSVDVLRAHGKAVFLDLKLHDIPNTVARAVNAASRHHVHLLTVHAGGGRDMLRAAADAARDAGPEAPRLVAVTMLTSLDQQDLSDQAIARSPKDHVLALADLALACGMNGLVCSAQELRALRQRFGPEPLLVTPGIRLADAAANDQKRIATPGSAVRDGATHLVVGRPILDAKDPAAAARRFLDAMAAAS